MSKKQTLIERAPWRRAIDREVGESLHLMAEDLRRRGNTVSLVAEEPETSHLGWRLRVYPKSYRDG